MRYPYILWLCFVFLIHCNSSPALLQNTSDSNNPNISSSLNNVSITSVELSVADSFELNVTQKRQLYLSTVNLSNGGAFYNLTQKLESAYTHLNQNIIWFSEDTSLATVTNGLVQAISPGKVTIKASLGNKSDIVTLYIDSKPSSSSSSSQQNDSESDSSLDNTDESEDTSQIVWYEIEDHFINSDDIITLNLGENGGYGILETSDLPYQIIYDEPDASLLHVLSLGHGGSITIELAENKSIIDGPGVDFIIFENPFAVLGDTSNYWTERALVEVSLDGQNWYSYPCDPFDENQDDDFEKCAGVQHVNYTNQPWDYLNQNLSGGDQFDLSDLGLNEIHFIKITDLKTCISSSIVCGGNMKGFDLDAIGFININFKE